MLGAVFSTFVRYFNSTTSLLTHVKHINSQNANHAAAAAAAADSEKGNTRPQTSWCLLFVVYSNSIDHMHALHRRPACSRTGLL